MNNKKEAIRTMGKMCRKNTHLKNQADANEEFVRSRCLGYMIRIVGRYSVWDTSTFDFLSWLLGNRADDLRKILISSLPKTPQRTILEMEEVKPSDMDNQIQGMTFAMSRIPRNRLRSTETQVVALLEDKFRKTRSGKRSKMAANLQEFTTLFGLSEEEAELCLFLAIMSSWSQAEVFFDTHLNCDRYAGRKYLVSALGLSIGKLEKMIHGRLHRLRFVHQDHNWLELSKDCLPLINESVQAVLTREHYKPLAKPAVALDSHVVKCEDLEHLRELLAKPQASATHVLFYGPPGTGKTSFTRALASSLGCPAFEVMNNTENKAQNRRLGLIACLNLTNHGGGSLVVVDEADSLLNTDDGWFMRGESQDKGWLNVLLEEPGTRVIWITNRVKNIDPSVRRRFAYSLHFPKFGRRQRVQLWNSILRKHRIKRFFNQEDILQLADQFEVSAGAMDLAVDKARATDFDGKGDLLTRVHRSLAAHLTLQRGGLPTREKDLRQTQYALEALNLDCGPTELVAQVKRFDSWWRQPVTDRLVRNFNLLFHGPSGTGKSELARHLAHQLDRPLLVKRTSDLLGSYVGETERALAAAFAQAETDEAILLIDEADSLLFPRGRAQRSWEISFTNEFLTQMERFCGLLICTTNRVTDLDDASMRRFGRKVEFGYLKAEGIWILYDRLLCSLAGGHLPASKRVILGRIGFLTPGIFRVVRDEALMRRGEMGHEELIAGLRKEAGVLKTRAGAAIGFG